MRSQKKILNKTIKVGLSTLLSRFFGIVREVLMVKYLGVSGLSDAFLTAYKIPNSLRKVFAEGALSAAFIPTIVTTVHHDNKNNIAGLMSLAFLVFEGIVVIICIFIMNYAAYIIHFIAPGFSDNQVNATIPMLYILMPFILFISSSALLAGALNAIDHFLIPAIAPIVINFIFIIGICVCLFFHLPVTTLCYFVVFAGFIHFIMHLIMYIKFKFFFGKITKEDFFIFIRIVGKFLLCIPSISLMEIALFIDTSFASFLAPGSISLLFYANRFVGIPLGVFAVAFSTILLPHFSRIHTYSPKRLHFYLLESAKFILWVTAPVALLMGFFSQEIFSTIFLSKNFTVMQVQQAGNILLVLLLGLFFFSLNKILLNIFYAMHAAWVPAVIALCATTINIILNMLFIEKLQTVGLALATTLSSSIQTVLFLFILYRKYKFRIYILSFLSFAMRYVIQLSIVSSVFLFCYYNFMAAIVQWLPSAIASFFTVDIGLWLWVGPLSLLFIIMLYFSRTLFKINLHFLK
ncbi:MAG TPA: murein biosynthesis integral membrane protein MurJ [Candidatus Babeliales bacterium]|nr:murein biosynthesis integral membrane protein MurJ [Candidatus Babeliales bacterium]